MSKALVSGVAGFIGSHLAERLIEEELDVIGVDSFEDYYPRWIKEKNIEGLLKSPKFTFVEANLLSDSLFNSSFQVYTNNNILTTQRLLELAKDLNIRKFIYASSSSVYGNVQNLPIKEDTATRPLSPYGVSKLAGENLCYLYWRNFGIPVVCLRYFTVYGPRQRPDMAFHKFIKGIVRGEEICIYGDGTQTRDFTYVSDVVEANLLALNAPSGEIFNIGGGRRISLMDALRLIEALLKRKARVRKMDLQGGY